MSVEKAAGSKRRRWIFAVIAVAVVAILFLLLIHVVSAIRLTLGMYKLSLGSTGQGLAFKEEKVRRQAGTQELEALIYYPAGSLPTQAIVMAAGISELGCYHPRLQALSRVLADSGMLVITPDIKIFRQFQISAEPINEFIFWFDQAKTLKVGSKLQKVGLAGISYSGTLALMAAVRPEVRDRVSFVVGIGSYFNLTQCTKFWFDAGPVTVSEGYYPTRFYAKWVIMLAALDTIASNEDRVYLHDLLQNLLLQKKISPPDSPLTSEGERWRRLAIMREDQADPELSHQIESHLTQRLYRQLDPREALPELSCPVFLIHGSYDDLIPFTESQELHKRIENSYLLISPVLTHTHPSDKQMSLSRKIRSAFETVVFLFRFSKAAKG
jgi:pimeloyl-ACP methyl ester carboxylesterase